MTVVTIDELYRDFETDGVPSSGPHEVRKRDIRDTLNALLQQGNRTRLSAGRTYYVRADGDDVNDGLTNNAGGAFLTLQKAIDTVYENVDLKGETVTIQVADGTYTGGAVLVGRFLGPSGELIFQGNTTTPANCIISTTSARCFSGSGGARATIKGFKVQTTTAGDCFEVSTGANFNITNIEYGACAGHHNNAGSFGVINITGNYTISGGGVSHWHGATGLVQVGTLTVTLTGTPAFSAYFCGTSFGAVYCTGVTFSGSATGRRYVAHYAGTIVAGGTDNTFLPGSAAGRSDAGGIYIGGSNSEYEIAPEILNTCSLAIKSINFNTQVRTTRILMQNQNNADFGYFYMNGENCYSSGMTHFGGTTQVAVGSGTADGFTFSSLTTVAGGGTVFTASANGAGVGNLRRRSSDGAILSFFRDTSNVGSISVTGSATAYNTSSDYRLKTKVKVMDGPIERLMALKPVNFAWKADGKRVDGFLAHEVQEIVPEAVNGDKDAEEDIGTAFRPAQIIKGESIEMVGPDGKPVTATPPNLEMTEDTIEGILERDAPAGYSWTKTGRRPVYQGIDQAKLVPLLTAALQAAIKRIEVLEAKLG